MLTRLSLACVVFAVGCATSPEEAQLNLLLNDGAYRESVNKPLSSGDDGWTAQLERDATRERRDLCTDDRKVLRATGVPVPILMSASTTLTGLASCKTTPQSASHQLNVLVNEKGLLSVERKDTELNGVTKRSWTTHQLRDGMLLVVRGVFNRAGQATIGAACVAAGGQAPGRFDSFGVGAGQVHVGCGLADSTVVVPFADLSGAAENPVLGLALGSAPVRAASPPTPMVTSPAATTAQPATTSPSTVVASQSAPFSFKLAASSFKAFQTIPLTYSPAVVAPDGQFSIALVLSGADDTNTNGARAIADGATADVLMAGAPGKYEVRLLLTGKSTRVLQRANVTVSR